MLILKQSTAVTIKIGPFLDSTDGVTAETALTISQADVRLSKNGADIAQKTETTSCTHDEIGVYDCPLDATDTATLGVLQLWVAESGALPVWHEYMVMPANVWDSLFGADALQVHAVEIAADLITAAALTTDAGAEIGTAVWATTSRLLTAGTNIALAKGAGVTGFNDLDAAGVRSAVGLATANLDTQLDALPTTAEVNAEVDTALADANLDHIAGTATGIPAIPAGTYLDQIMDDGTAVYDRTTDSLQAIADSSSGDPTAAAIADAVWDEAASGHVGAGTFGAQAGTDIDAILADTNELQTDWADGGRLDLILDAITAEAGAGAVTWVTTITDGDSNPLTSADVWATSDAAGNNILASGETNSSGQVTFYLDAGTVYIWVQKDGYNFTNPTTVTVTA